MYIHVVNAFSHQGAGGNGAGVAFLDSPLSAQEKTDIAHRLGFSETVFVTESVVADYQLEYFTPEGEVPLCGHATIGAFVVLQALGSLKKSAYTIQTKAGVLAVTLEDGGRVFMEQTLPIYYNTLQPQEVQRCFAPLPLAQELPIQLVSTGLKDVMLPLATPEALATMTPQFPAITALSQEQTCVGIHAFALTPGADCTAICRNFAPLYGIDEEAATGTSNCALACYLFAQGLRQPTYVFHQGHQLGSVSAICVQLQWQDQTITSVAVGGTGYLLEGISLA